MKNLIRPLLFTVARTGLFLVAVAWIVGQCWHVDLNLGFSGPYVGAIVAGDGITVACGTGGRRTGMSTEAVGSRDRPSLLDPRVVRHFREDLRFSATSVPTCVTFIHNIGGGIQATVAHWFIVSLSIAVNATLHFIYRKRREATPCEV